MNEILARQIEAATSRLKDDISIAAIEDAARSPLMTGLIPQEIWALVAFLRHERRQQWVGHIVESRLSGDGAELASSGAFAHPEEIGQMGKVPGEDGWEYFFHGRGCCFTHRDGTTLDVDFADDGSALEIDVYFYNGFLSSSPGLGWCERQLKHPEGLEDAWHFGLARLAELTLIQREWRFRLSDAGRKMAQMLEPLVEAIDLNDGACRCYILAVLGDFVAADEAAKRTNIHADFLVAPALRQKEQRCAALRSALHGDDETQAHLAMEALAVLGKDVAFDEAQNALRRQPVTTLNHKALAALSQWNGSDVIQCLADTLSQLTSASVTERIRGWLRSTATVNERRSHLGLIVGVSQTLFQMVEPHEMPAKMRSALTHALRGDCGACDEEAGFFLYLLDSDAGRKKLAANLSNSVPIARGGAACFLAMIGDDWCVDALVRAANGPIECGGHEAACALSLLESDKAKSAALQWQRRNDGYEDAEGSEIEIGGKTFRTWSMDEVMRSNMREDLLYHYERAQEKFGPLLGRWKENADSAMDF